MRSVKLALADSRRENRLPETWQRLFETIAPGQHDDGQVFGARIDVFYEGETTDLGYILCSGFAYSCKRLTDGTRRIVDIHIPGDVLGWSNLVLGSSLVEVQTLTEIRAVSVTRSQVTDAMRRDLHNARRLIGSLGRSHVLLTEHVVNLGRNATARVAAFFLELEARCARIGATSRNTFKLPIPQNVIADAIGITPVHVNRVLRNLRQTNCLSFQEGLVTMLDREKLMELSGFDPAFVRGLED